MPSEVVNICCPSRSVVAPSPRLDDVDAHPAGFTYLKQAAEADGALFNRYVHDLRGAQPQG
ncbi:hypothetical protein [Streptomyces yanii]|uniref:Uncharacterized protein n=1 Tax=Streptomyces yanii TaxID=78510 RepID=A0ABV5RK16_9ACTN